MTRSKDNHKFVDDPEGLYLSEVKGNDGLMGAVQAFGESGEAVSYTHLTLPTIYSV